MPGEPRTGRSYTSASGAFVRVDHVLPGGVLAVLWPAGWRHRGDCKCVRLTPGEWAVLAERHDLQPVKPTGGQTDAR